MHCVYCFEEEGELIKICHPNCTRCACMECAPFFIFSENCDSCNRVLEWRPPVLFVKFPAHELFQYDISESLRPTEKKMMHAQSIMVGFFKTHVNIASISIVLTLMVCSYFDLSRVYVFLEFSGLFMFLEFSGLDTDYQQPLSLNLVPYVALFAPFYNLLFFVQLVTTIKQLNWSCTHYINGAYSRIP